MNERSKKETGKLKEAQIIVQSGEESEEEKNSSEEESSSEEEEESDEDGEETVESLKEKVNGLKEKMKQLLEYTSNYMRHSEGNISNLKKEREKDREEWTKMEQLMKNEIIELEEENASFEKQFDQMTREYEDTIQEMKEEKKVKNKENIDNLQTLITELTNIEEVNASLTLELEEEKKKNLTITEELELSKKIMQQMEVKIGNQQKQISRQSVSINSLSPTLAGDQSEDIVKHLLNKMSEVGQLAMQLRLIAVPDDPMANEAQNAAKLVEEKQLHEQTKKLLEVEKSKNATKNIHYLQSHVNHLIDKQNMSSKELSPRSKPASLTKGQTFRSMVNSINSAVAENEENLDGTASAKVQPQLQKNRLTNSGRLNNKTWSRFDSDDGEPHSSPEKTSNDPKNLSDSTSESDHIVFSDSSQKSGSQSITAMVAENVYEEQSPEPTRTPTPSSLFEMLQNGQLKNAAKSTIFSKSNNAFNLGGILDFTGSSKKEKKTKKGMEWKTSVTADMGNLLKPKK
eukprot:TRINITY_DN309_c0_g1_i1.p1 TRINITY_DN309_c0_g1~~TRINITY_DN309_c0_g1_i1.p1  ORF type:complete len:552 (+),score=218.12 TRINITY_DN309_c0_g1_i1:113-1657(+)